MKLPPSLLFLVFALSLPGAECSLRLRMVDSNDVIAVVKLVLLSLGKQSFAITSPLEDKVLNLPCDGYFLSTGENYGVYPLRVGPIFLQPSATLDLLVPISGVTSSLHPAKRLQFATWQIPGSPASVLIRYEISETTPRGTRYSGEDLQVSIGRFVFTGGTMECLPAGPCQLVGPSRVNLGMKLIGVGTASIGASGITLKTLTATHSFSLREANAIP